jgi:hypothetical protein
MIQNSRGVLNADKFQFLAKRVPYHVETEGLDKLNSFVPFISSQTDGLTTFTALDLDTPDVEMSSCRISGADASYVSLAVADYFLICPFPNMMNLVEVNSSRPMGPRAWILVVEIPISAPKPNSYPSFSRVDAFTKTADASTSR